MAAPEDGRFVAAITKLTGKDIPTGTIEGIGAAELSFEESGRRGRGKPARKHADGERRPGEREGRRRDQHPPREARPNRREEARTHEPRHAPREVPRPITMDPDGKVTPLPPRRDDHRHDRDDDHRVVGFGDHLPAFLARPVRVARG
jgi:hypothetical protein